MSSDEQVFFDPGTITLFEAGRRVAEALDVNPRVHEDSVTLTTSMEDAGQTVDVYCAVETNIFSDSEPETPAEEQVFDDMPYVIQIRTLKRQSEHQRVVARNLYFRLVDALHWRSALTGEYSLLFATYDTERGLRTFPPGTSSEGTDAHLWR